MPPSKQLSHNRQVPPVLQLVMEMGLLKMGDFAMCSVDHLHCKPTASNHTMMHVLNCTLGKVLAKDPQAQGKQVMFAVDQKGDC
jgi:alanyl-tRNA synthetase